MRYSAATCDPADFDAERFTLRQKLFAKPRHTELFIVITMYNEEDELRGARTREEDRSLRRKRWPCKINPRTRAVLAALGVYQDGIAKQQVNGKDVTAHIYEYTTQMTLDIKKGVVGVKRETPGADAAFGTVLDPNVCVLIDAGTKPGKDSVYQLWKAFDLEPMCAGACATQNFEYKMSNILDKPLESAFGFISVLPGAFSAYRYVALQNDKTGQGPLEKYFAGEKMHGANAGIFTANMYLAEDRILCFELVSKRNCHWILQYVKSATGETDVPTTMAEFISQRRRWLNGSFFAAVYALAHSFDIFRSDHSFLRKTMFLVEFVYQTISMIFAWFALGNFFLVFRILTASLQNDLGTVGKVLFIIFEWLYIAVLITCFILSLGNRPKVQTSVFITVRSVQGQIAANNGFNVGDLFKDKIFATLVISLLSTYVMWLIVSIIFLDPWHMFTSFFQYLLMTPTYINILNVYAFCNTHDITWGTKGDDKAENSQSSSRKQMYETELRVFSEKWKEEKKIPSPSEKQEDYYKGISIGRCSVLDVL
ncbi:Glycosyltransferase family 2 protein (mitochondrion) [Pyrenophora tritici-repentis]|nr:Glycosyltransferase family 2 protein [Pyrenophora tritici-repentis]